MGSALGKIFKIMTFGESHGKAVGVIIDGVQPNIDISEKDIQAELNKRRPGQSKVSTSRNEDDKVEVLSGIFEGKTTGHPICLVVWNKDSNSSKYEKIKDLFRPGHADFTYLKKYGIRDYRGGGRSSGRETIGRVAAGAVAKKIVEKKKIKIIAYTKQIGKIKAEKIDYDEIEKNPVRCPDKIKAKAMEDLILKVKSGGDSIGGIIECAIFNAPPGLGSPVFNKLSAELAKAMISIPGVKGIEFGAGFSFAEMQGSECNDAFDVADGKIVTKTNNSGGLLGGISNGMPIIFRIAVKPTSSIFKEQETMTIDGKKAKIKVEGRHDPCICPRIVPVVESMAAIVLADAIMEQEAIDNGYNN